MVKTIQDICREAPEMIGNLLKKKVEGVTGLIKQGEIWNVHVEVLERRAVPDTQDILSIYELKLTDDMNLEGYRRIGVRKRGNMIVEEAE